MKMRLYISSGRHFFTDTERRLQRIEDALGKPDVVFVESRPANKPSLEKRGQIWLLSPVLLSSILIWLLFLRLVTVPFSSDDDVLHHLVENRDCQRYNVDKSIYHIVEQQSYIWAISNWSLIAGPAVLVWLTSAPAGLLLACFVLVAGSASIMTSYLAGTMAERNLHMTQNIDRISRDSDIESACLLVGGHHETGIKEIASQYDSIEIIEIEHSTGRKRTK